MNGDPHAKASQLMAQELVEGISAGDRQWLDDHLASCPACGETARVTDDAVRSLRGHMVPLPPALASRTQLRVYLRTQEHRRGGWLLWAACGISWAVGIASSPYVWRGFEWLGNQVGLPPLLWKLGFGLWWAVPSLLAAGALWLDKADGEGFRTR